MTADFIAQRGRKTFQCNFASGPSPQEFLGTAANGLAGLVDKFTGKRIWSIAKPLPLPERPTGFYVHATCHYPLASIGGTVSLTLGAMPEGAAGTSVVAMFEDSMGWDIAPGEMSVDDAMGRMDYTLNARYPSHGGWRMTGGLWRFGHRFAAAPGVPPPPPYVEQERTAPEDLFSSGRTSRGYGAPFPAEPPAALLHRAGDALGRRWTLEYFADDSTGMPQEMFTGVGSGWPQRSFHVTGICNAMDRGLYLMLIFADEGYWTSLEATQALETSIGAVNEMLAASHGRVLAWLPPPQP